MDKVDDAHSSGELWSVFDFVRRYRLDKKEEVRLLALFGNIAPLDKLLVNARRHLLVG